MTYLNGYIHDDSLVISRFIFMTMKIRHHNNTYYLFGLLQDGLRRRMDKLKSSIEEANRAVDKEREKNVSLLHLIFPPDIAKRLWLGMYYLLYFYI